MDFANFGDRIGSADRRWISPQMRHVDLTPQNGNSKSPKGRETQRVILETALQIFLEYGYGSFSIQKVSEYCGLSRGNVSYYYPTRNALLHDLLQAVVSGYTAEFEEVSRDETLNAEEKFLKIIEMIMMDLSTPETTSFFPELWALANHDEDAKREMELLYRSARIHLTELLKDINPSLTEKERELFGLFVSAAMEGHTPFVGHDREFEGDLESIKNIAAYSFLEAAKSINKNIIKKS